MKFFENEKGGGVGSVYYLLNDRVQEGTAKLLRGDKEITLSLINAIEFKHKVTFGSLNFTEKNLPDKIKTEIMDRFEKMLLAGLERDKNYNILWVEHTDKENLELNFVIPKIELQSLKSLQPYYHKADLSRVDTFKEIINLEYDLSDPNDPARGSRISGSRKKKELFKSIQELDEIVQEQVLNGRLNSRDEIIAYLRENGVEVPKISQEYISVKLPEAKSNKRLKGAVYNERFASIKSLEAELDRVEARISDYQRERIANRFPRLRELNERLERLCVTKARENNGRFERSSKRNQEFTSRTIRNDTSRIQEQHEPTTRSEQDLQERAEGAPIQSFEPSTGVYQQGTSLDSSGRSRMFGGGLHPLQNDILGGSNERERILRELVESTTQRARERARKSNEAYRRAIESTRTREKRYIEQNAEFRSWLDGAIESFEQWSRERTRRRFTGLSELTQSVFRAISSTIQTAIRAFGDTVARISADHHRERQGQERQQGNVEYTQTQTIDEEQESGSKMRM